jgi:hypothetical protein
LAVIVQPWGAQEVAGAPVQSDPVAGWLPTVPRVVLIVRPTIHPSDRGHRGGRGDGPIQGRRVTLSRFFLIFRVYVFHPLVRASLSQCVVPGKVPQPAA